VYVFALCGITLIRNFFEEVVLIRVFRDVVSWWVLTCVVMNFRVLCKGSWGGGH